MLGMAGIDRSGDLLGELYHDAASHEVREAVIHSYLASDEPAPLVRLLKSETDAALQREIIQVLGAMDASAEISEIYPKLQDKESKIAAIEAFSVGGGSEMLHDLLASETDPELRRAAIVGIAVDGDTGSAALLESLYASASSPEEKSGILEALQIMGSGTDLALNIIRTEADPGLKRQAIEALAVMGANTQLRTLYSTLEDAESRAVVLNALAIAEDSAALMDILQAETNPDLRARAIDSLSVSGGSGVTEYLVSIYPQVSRDEKHAVIQSLMIDENASRLINLIGQETDPEMKREMLRALAMMDTEESQNFLFELLESEQ
jgi:HEAT repeat protein